MLGVKDPELAEGREGAVSRNIRKPEDLPKVIVLRKALEAGAATCT